jgi:hypothetical protein
MPSLLTLALGKTCEDAKACNVGSSATICKDRVRGPNQRQGKKEGPSFSGLLQQKDINTSGTTPDMVAEYRF